MRSKAPNTRPKTNVVVSYVPLPAVPTTPCCADDAEDIDEGELFPSPPSPPPLPPLPSCDGRIANVAAVVVNIIPLSADATSAGVVVVGTVLMAELVVREVEGVVVGEEVVGVVVGEEVVGEVVREGVVVVVVMVVMLLELRRAIVEVVRSTGTPIPPIPPASPTGSLEPSRWSVVARVVSLKASLRRSSISRPKKERDKKKKNSTDENNIHTCQHHAQYASNPRANTDKRAGDVQCTTKTGVRRRKSAPTEKNRIVYVYLMDCIKYKMAIGRAQQCRTLLRHSIDCTNSYTCAWCTIPRQSFVRNEEQVKSSENWCE